MAAQCVKLVPRKKFTLQSEIKCSLARFKHQYNGTWNFIPDRRILRIITEQYTNKSLYVKGQNAVELGLCRIELLAYMHSLPLPDEKEKPTGKRLAQIPLFYLDVIPSDKYNAQNYSYKASLKDMRAEYLNQESLHKSQEGHHPDGIGWNAGIDSTIECVFDVYSGILRFNSVKSSYLKLLDLLKDEKFANLTPDGIFYALMHIIVRGVANQERIKSSAEWRQRNASQQQLWKYTHDFANGIPPPWLIQGYRGELVLHSRVVTQEIKRLRIGNIWHDCTKYRPDSVYWYTWNWGVWNFLSEQNKKMLDLGISMLDMSPDNHSPTMFGLGSSFAQGALSNPEFSQVLAFARQIPEEFEKKADKIADKIDERLTLKEEKFKETAQEILKEFKDASNELVDETLDKITAKSQDLGQALMESVDPILSVLKNLTGLIDNVVQQINLFFQPLEGFAGLKVSVSSLIEAIKYYIMYINCSSQPLKLVLVFLILQSLGIASNIWKWVLQFWKWASSSVYNGEVVDACETSFLEWIQDSPTKFLQILGGAFASLAKGTSLTLEEFLKMSKSLSDKMRNFHFIGMGIAGVERIFDYARRFWNFITEWISLHVFGRTPEREAKAKEVMKLILLAKYFSSEAGLNAIRMSENARLRAESLFPEYMRLIAETRDNKDYRTMFVDLERSYRQIKDVANFVTRFRSVSNFQPTMFHIQLVGKPGIGKSTLTKNLVGDLTKSLWPEEPKPSFYSLNMNLEYFDGYAGQKIMIADDVYKMNEPKHMTSTIGLITNTPVILPMANLEDKGVQLTSEIFLSSTNTAYPIAKDVLCMEAVHRRRHMLVQVHCDPRVIDSGCSQFSESLFRKFYPGQQKSDFPHLKFGLIKPVPKEFGGAAEQVLVGDDEFEVYAEYAKLLKEANFKIACGQEELDPCFYFTEDNLPGGFLYPASGWTYKQFLSNCVVRFRSFRGMEGTYSSETKFSHVETCLSEIDLIFSQSDDIQAEEMPQVPLIQNYISDMMHPYGSEDPIGKRIAKGEKLSPELDNIDFDKLVDDIIADKKSNYNMPTGDVIDLEEERLRRKRIMEKRKKKAVPMQIRNMLKVKNFGLFRKILLVENPTQWESLPFDTKDLADAIVLSQVLNTGNKYAPEIKILNKILASHGRNERIQEADSQIRSISGWLKTIVQLAQTPAEAYQVLAETVRLTVSQEMPWPDGYECRGCSTGIPLSFLHRLEKVDGLWYMDVTNLSVDAKPPIVTKKLDAGDGEEEFKIPQDIAFWLSQMVEFRMFLSRFFSLTEEEREDLVREAKFTNYFTGTYTYEKIAEDCENIYGKFAYKTLSYLTTPFKWFANTFPQTVMYAGILLAFSAVIYTIKQVCSLFNPEPTSKVLHRGPQSGIVYRGSPTNCQPMQVTEGLINRNVKKIKLADSHLSVAGQGLHTGQFMVLNKHLTRWMKDDDLVLTISDDSGDHEYAVSRTNIVEEPKGDLAILYSRYLPAARAVDHHFILESDFENSDFKQDLTILTRREKYATVEHFPVIGKCENIVLQNSEYETSLNRCLMVSGNTVLGNSGSPVVAHLQGKSVIVGIQAWKLDALYAPKIAIQVVTKEKFDELTRKLAIASDDPIVKRLFDPEPEDCIPTGAFASVPQESIICKDEHVVGDVGRNQIKPSFISAHLAKAGIETKRVPAPMSERDPRLYHGSKIHPLEHSLGKYYRGSMKPISPNIVNRATHMLQKYISSRLDTSDFSPLNIEDTITGTREDGSNPMNLKSSPGIPFIFEKRERKGKRDYMEIGEDGEIVQIDEQFINEYFKFEQSLMKGEVPYTRAYDFPKDELRGIEKALGSETTPPRTRSVTCMNVYYILAWRRYTLKFWSSMHRAADGTFTFCPGINPEGPEWSNLYHYLNKHPHCVDFDVSNWDGFLFSQLFYRVLDIIKKCMGVKKKSKIDFLLTSIFYDVMNCYIQFLDIVYQKHRGLVSGFPGTAEVNTLVHWLLILCIYLIITQGTNFCNFEAFIKLTSIAIYGDDIIITFSQEIMELFNGLTIKKCYEDIGYPVTSATKAAEVEFSKKLLDCKFLKSTWTEFTSGYYIRKMDMEVAYDLVHWVRAKQHPRQQFFENYIDALRIAFGNGKQVFVKFQQAVNDVLTKFNEDNIYYSFEDFEIDYINRYLPDLKVTFNYSIV